MTIASPSPVGQSGLNSGARMTERAKALSGGGGHGLKVSHMTSEIMADVVAATFEHMDRLEKLRHVPMPLSDKLGNYPVTLGMLYYRLLDLR